MLIRPAIPGDAARVAAILGVPPRDAAPGALCLIAQGDTGVEAVLHSVGVGGRLHQIRALQVAPPVRRRGIGTALLIALADRLAAVGVPGVAIDIPPGSAMLRDWLVRRGAQAAGDGSLVWPDPAAMGTAARAARLAHLTPPLAVTAAHVPGLAGAPHPVANGARARGRVKQRLGDVFGLSDFGVNRVTLAPGCWSSIPHVHSREDEFVLVLQGALTLVCGAETRVLLPGDCAGFAAAGGRAHHLENRSDTPAVYLEVGSRRPEADEVDYADEDLRVARRPDGSRGFVRRDGTPVADGPESV